MVVAVALALAAAHQRTLVVLALVAVVVSGSTATATAARVDDGRLSRLKSRVIAAALVEAGAAAIGAAQSIITCLPAADGGDGPDGRLAIVPVADAVAARAQP